MIRAVAVLALAFCCNIASAEPRTSIGPLEQVFLLGFFVLTPGIIPAAAVGAAAWRMRTVGTGGFFLPCMGASAFSYLTTPLLYAIWVRSIVESAKESLSVTGGDIYWGVLAVAGPVVLALLVGLPVALIVRVHQGLGVRILAMALVLLVLVLIFRSFLSNGAAFLSGLIWTDLILLAVLWVWAFLATVGSVARRSPRGFSSGGEHEGENPAV